MVIADTPAPPHVRVKVFNHLLGESETAFFAPPGLAAQLRRRFPRSLNDARLLLPTANAALCRALDESFEKEKLRPRVVGEFEDSARASEHDVTTREWKSYGAKSGWSLRVMRGKRTIVWLVPSTACFEVAFIFGEKALAAIRQARFPRECSGCSTRLPKIRKAQAFASRSRR